MMTKRQRRSKKARNQVEHHAAALRGIACALRRVEHPSLKLKVAAAKLDVIAAKLIGLENHIERTPDGPFDIAKESIRKPEPCRQDRINKERSTSHNSAD